MRVTFVTGSFPAMHCGVGDYTARLVESLLTIDPTIQVNVITTANSKVTVPGCSGWTINQISSWRLGMLPRLMRMIEAARPDVVHIQYPAAGYNNGLAPNILPLAASLLQPGFPVVVTLHEFSVAHPLRRLSALFFLLCARRIVVCDGREQRAVNRFLRLRRQKATLLPLAANIPVFAPFISMNRYTSEQQNPRRDGRELTLCYFGFVSKSKDVFFLLKVLASLRGEGLPLRLLLIGGITREARGKLSALMDDLELTEYVTLTGFCPPETVSRHLTESDVALFPFRDGVSLRRSTFLTAMQHGLPVVTTRAKGYLPEGLSDGYNVCLVDVWDEAGFIAKARRLVHDAGLRAKLGRNALNWGKSFDWLTVAKGHLSLYEGMVKRRSATDEP